MATDSAEVSARTRPPLGTYVLATLGLLLLALAMYAGSRSLAVTVDGSTVACGSVFDHPNVRNLLSFDALFTGREGCPLELAKAHVSSLVACVLGILTVAVASVRLANRRQLRAMQRAARRSE